MSSIRSDAASAQLQDGKLIVTGGGDAFNSLNNFTK
jgi:hypothetical protein